MTGGGIYRVLLGVVGVITLAAVVGVVALWPDDAGSDLAEPNPAQQTRVLDATITDVTEVAEADMTGLPPGAVSVTITASLDDSGETLAFETTDDTGETFSAGQRVRIAEITSVDQPTTYYVSDFRRGRELAVLALLFVGVVLAFGRWQGARALLGLGVTFLIIVGFMVPAILDGRSPVAVAIAGSLAIMIATLYLSHGWSRKTTAAVVGTAGALLLTAGLAAVFVSAAQLTGFASEEARLASLEVGGLSLRGLLLAGIIVGGLGVLDDVTMAQASTVFALARSDPRARFSQLLREALVVGRDHVAATVNTLFLAYAGAALPLLLLFVTANDPAGTVLTSEIVAVEVVRTLVGSIGLIAAVPLTTALAALLVVDDRGAVAAEGEGHVHGEPPAPRSAPEPRGTPGDEPAGDTFDDVAPWRADGDEGDVEDEEWVERLRESYRLPPRDDPKRGGGRRGS